MKYLEDFDYHYLGLFRSNVLNNAILKEIKHIFKNPPN